MSSKRVAWIRAGMLLCLLFFDSVASAQVLDTLEVTRQGSLAVIEANFSRPVFYVRHFPPTSGETLQIYLQVPVVLSEPLQREISVRKSIKAPPVDHLPLQDVTYEGRGVEGPRLIVRFTRPVHYSIEKGRNNRSIKIIVRVGAPPAAPKPSRKVPATPKSTPAPGLPEISRRSRPSEKEPSSTAKNYVVTIVPSLTTTPDMVSVKKKLLKEFPDRVVYQVTASIFGKTVNFVRLGFFLRLRRQRPHSISFRQLIP
jgi:hypothetical protein